MVPGDSRDFPRTLRSGSADTGVLCVGYQDSDVNGNSFIGVGLIFLATVFLNIWNYSFCNPVVKDIIIDMRLRSRHADPGSALTGHSGNRQISAQQ